MTEYYVPGATPAFVNDGQPFRTAVLQYPANWLRLASDEERAAIGAVPAPEVDPHAQRLVRDPQTGWQIGAWTADDLAAQLEVAKAAATAGIDAMAGQRRARYVTISPGQEQAYVEKEKEARAHLAGGAGPWPFLEAEAAAVGVSVADLAAEVLATANAWRVAAAGIEAIRRGAKVRIGAALSLADIATATADLPWPD